MKWPLNVLILISTHFCNDRLIDIYIDRNIISADKWWQQCITWLSVGRCVTFSAKKSGFFRAVVCSNRELDVLKLLKFLLFPLSFFLKRSDCQIVGSEKHQLWTSKTPLFFCNFSGYQRTFRPRVICKKFQPKKWGFVRIFQPDLSFIFSKSPLFSLFLT